MEEIQTSEALHSSATVRTAMVLSLWPIQESFDKHWEMFPNLFKQLENKMLSQKSV